MTAVVGLRAADQSAGQPRSQPDWNSLVDQFQPLINSVCRHFRLRPDDAADVSQTVWLTVVDKWTTLRDPNALPGWIKTIAHRTACNLLRRTDRTLLIGDASQAEELMWSWQGSVSDDAPDTGLLRDELREAVHCGLDELPQQSQDLVQLLVADPPVSYRQISELMNMPIGSIGPTRARCLDKLASSEAIRALVGEAA